MESDDPVISDGLLMKDFNFLPSISIKLFSQYHYDYVQPIVFQNETELEDSSNLDIDVTKLS